MQTKDFTPEQRNKLYALDLMARWFYGYFNRRVRAISGVANDA